MAETAERNWDAFFRRYRAMALRFARGLARDPALAEDWVQEAARAMVARAASGALRFESDVHARNYLFRAIHNLAASARRRAGPAGTLPEELAAPGPSPAQAALDGEAALAHAELGRRVAAAVEALRPEEREVLRLRFGEGLAYREIAARTGRSISTLQARCQAALGKIRRRLGKAPAEA